MDVKFIDTSDWQILRWLSSGGTREKRILQDTNDLKWYFKCSERKPASPTQPEKHYKFEFWSEVIAYQLGKFLGLDILRYDVGYSEGDIGCISPEMDAAEDEQLVEVGRYMTTYHPAFAPDDNQARKEYTFQLLEETIQHFGLQKYWPNFLATLVFDAIIGNTDRHQENWAFIGNAYSDLGTALANMDAQQKKSTKEMLASIGSAYTDSKTESFNRLFEEFRLRIISLKRMAPIYDSGSSLARELTDERVRVLLQDEEQLVRYMERGNAEVHWSGKKKSHFTILEKILATAHADMLRDAASFLHKWDDEYVEQLVGLIDECIPEEHAEFKIPSDRKKMMVKLLTLRHRRVRDIIYG